MRTGSQPACFVVLVFRTGRLQRSSKHLRIHETAIMPKPPMLTHREHLFYTLLQWFTNQHQLDGQWYQELMDHLNEYQHSWTADFINFIERTPLPEGIFLVSVHVTSLYTNIPQGEGIDTICRAYANFYGDKTPIPTHSLKEILRGNISGRVTRSSTQLNIPLFKTKSGQRSFFTEL